MTDLWQCKYCRRSMHNERVYMKHDCTAMQRSREIQSVAGQMAYGLYKHWLEKQRRKPPPVEVFCTSSYYTSLLRFAEWVRELNLPDPKQYVELMVTHKIAPALWRRNEAHQLYLEFIDKHSSPYDQAAVTVQTITALAEGLEIEAGAVFGQLKVGEVLELIQQRRLSPWLLFCSRRFKEWTESLHEADRTLLMKSIGIHYWAMRLEKAPEIVKNLKETAMELGI